MFLAGGHAFNVEHPRLSLWHFQTKDSRSGTGENIFCDWRRQDLATCNSHVSPLKAASQGITIHLRCFPWPPTHLSWKYMNALGSRWPHETSKGEIKRWFFAKIPVVAKNNLYFLWGQSYQQLSSETLERKDDQITRNWIPEFVLQFITRPVQWRVLNHAPKFQLCPLQPASVERYS